MTVIRSLVPALVLLAASITVMEVIITADEAHASHLDRKCWVRISDTGTSPVVRAASGDDRINPDGTYYPGDAFHFIYKYSGHRECMRFQVHPLEVSQNMHVMSLHRIDHDGKVHDHRFSTWGMRVDEQVVGHVFDVIDYEKSRKRCFHQNCVATWSETYTLSPAPSRSCIGPYLGALEDGPCDVSRAHLSVGTILNGTQAKELQYSGRGVMNWGAEEFDPDGEPITVKVSAGRYEPRGSPGRVMGYTSNHPILEEARVESLPRFDIHSLEEFCDSTRRISCSGLDDHHDTDMTKIHYGVPRDQTEFDALDALEHDEDVELFAEEVAAAGCGRGQKYSGCVYGHIELATEDTPPQWCITDDEAYYESLESRFGYWTKGNKNNPSKWRTDHNAIERYLAFVNYCAYPEERRLLFDSTRIEITGYGQYCSHNPTKCHTYKRQDTADIAYPTVNGTGPILFAFPQVYDRDGFPSKNLDATYYIDDAIGIHGWPDAVWKDERHATISFDTDITDTTVIEMDDHLCTGMHTCHSSVNHDRITEYLQDTGNGDLLSVHYEDSEHGIQNLLHYATLYNLGRPAGEWTGAAKPLVVWYDPVIDSEMTWSITNDGGTTSFENRYGTALKYAGSEGGGPGDTPGIHALRPMKVTDIYAVQAIQTPLGTDYAKWQSDVTMTDAAGLDDTSIHPTVRGYIPEDHPLKTVTGWADAAPVYWNGTVQDAMIEKEGYIRIAVDGDIPAEAAPMLYLNMTTHDTLASRDYGGEQVTWLHAYGYGYPLGRFSIPLNATAWHVTAPLPPEIDGETDILEIRIRDESPDLYGRVSLVEHMLYNKTDHKYSYLRLGDTYQMNVPAYPGGPTSVILLNRTGIAYPTSALPPLAERLGAASHGDAITEDESTLMTHISWHSIYVTAGREGAEATGVMLYGGFEAEPVIRIPVNMHPENVLLTEMYDDTAMVQGEREFGGIESAWVDGTRMRDSACAGDGCLLVLDRPGPALGVVTVQNEWGGIAVMRNVTAIAPDGTSEALYEEVIGYRIFYVLMGGAMIYVGYRAVRAMYTKRRQQG